MYIQGDTIEPMKRLPKPFHFVWDDGNKDKNWLKHQVSINEAEECFFDGNKRLVEDVVHSTNVEKTIPSPKFIFG